MTEEFTLRTAVESSRSPSAAARKAAAALVTGFAEHDRRNRSAAVEAFAVADKRQFAHLSEGEATEAAEAYVEALWQKDAIEDACRVDGDIDADAVADADWSAVKAAFQKRARIVGADPEYALFSTRGWVQHKAEGDYWTPLMRAQRHEIRAAIQDDSYPAKPRNGTSGFGPEPARYVVGVELHDTRRYEEAASVMEPYFDFILKQHE